ncbi:MAG: MBOAT family protein, partial [Solobacterium sp.]|nr:MBOAT family protein [Solobacterium sp.]
VLFGYFMKLVIAGRCALLCETVYENEAFHGLPVLLAILAYSMQIYTDFAGYSLIAKGLAYAMGIAVPDNFHQPYLSASIKEFWRRWHMSLSEWLKDYIYIPLGGSRKGALRTRINLLLTFLVSGFWHGTGLTFVVWGGLHGLFQIIEGEITKRSVKKEGSGRVLSIVITFLLVSLAWVFFRSGSVMEALGIFVRAMKPGQFGILFSESITTMGLDARNLRILGFALAVLCFADVYQYRNNDFMERFEQQNILVRLGMVWLLLFLIILSVNLSSAEFIYMQF